ncbi:MAG: fumarate hydratase [Alphaproteobacteria bacterium]|nr:fumarate hydratase [Alphaproteobacteria bacterium]
MSEVHYREMFPLGPDATPYRKIAGDFVETVKLGGETVLRVKAAGLSELAFQGFRDINHLFRPGHLAQLRAILDDPEASANDRFVALELLKNANISAGMVLPSCQDTGTALIMGKRGQFVWPEGDDEAALSEGARRAYVETNLRYSQVSAVEMYKEVNTKTNLPAQLDIAAVKGRKYEFLFIAKGGGSANKTFLHQATPSVLTPTALPKFLDGKLRELGTAACPPYHLAVVIGGTSAEINLKTVKLASCKYLDTLPTVGNDSGQAWRDTGIEAEILKMTQRSGIGAQFGGKYFCHDVRVVRLPRHGASLPIGIGVSCSADRQARAKATEEGLFLEQFETDPAKYLPETTADSLGGDCVKIDLDRPMSEIRATLSRYPIKTRLALSGTLIVARDAAHAKIKERLDRGEPMPAHFRDHIIYYAGPAKTPKGYASGSFGPTTAGRMDAFVDEFMAKGGGFVMLAKGNRGAAVREACKKHGGFYLGSIGGAAAILAEKAIKKVECVEYPELGMEAIWRIRVEDFPAFIIIDDKGNDFFDKLAH